MAMANGTWTWNMEMGKYGQKRATNKKGENKGAKEEGISGNFPPSFLRKHLLGIARL